MRNTASKDKNVRLERIIHTPNVQRLIYSGYGRQVGMTHEKAVGAGSGKNRGWEVDGCVGTYKKAAAIALVAKRLKDAEIAS